jgi:uncharacterized protein YuzE
VTITLAGITVDRVSSAAAAAAAADADADADVLYLHVGDPEGAVDFDESPEGHHVRFDVDGSLVGSRCCTRARSSIARGGCAWVPER